MQSKKTIRTDVSVKIEMFSISLCFNDFLSKSNNSIELKIINIKQIIDAQIVKISDR